LSSAGVEKQTWLEPQICVLTAVSQLAPKLSKQGSLMETFLSPFCPKQANPSWINKANWANNPLNES